MSLSNQKLFDNNANTFDDDEIRLRRQNPIDQSSFKDDRRENSKLKMAKASANIVDSQQSKITKYLPHSNSKKQHLSGLKLPTQLTHQYKNNKSLEARLKEIEEENQRLKQEKDAQHQKYAYILNQSRSYKKKANMIIAKEMLEIANIKRIEKFKRNESFGYFQNQFREFVEGDQFIKLREQIKSKEKLIEKYTGTRKGKNGEDHQRNISAIEILNKELQIYRNQLKYKEKQIDTYKQRLKLAEKELQCKYSKEGWPIIYSHYQTLELLGKGGFGEVYKCFDLEEGRVVALKVNSISKRQDPKNRELFIKHVKRQAEVQQQLNHPNIGKLLTLIECEQKVVFTLQYCNGPSLSYYLKKYGPLEEKEAKSIIRQIFCGLNYMFNLKERIIHYDLKPANIIFHDGIVKILDFGLCKRLQTEDTKMALTSQGVGTYWYLPPQTYEPFQPKVCSKVDVWSAGVIFYEMLYGKRPFGHQLSQQKIYEDKVILKANKVEFPNQTPKKHKVSDACKQFIRGCLQTSTKDRLNPNEAYDHPYFKK